MDLKAIKSNVLQQLIKDMEERMVSGLKKHSPKFMKIETNDPKMAESLKDKIVNGVQEEDGVEDLLKESGIAPQEDNEEDEEDIQRLLEMYRNLK